MEKIELVNRPAKGHNQCREDLGGLVHVSGGLVVLGLAQQGLNVPDISGQHCVEVMNRRFAAAPGLS